MSKCLRAVKAKKLGLVKKFQVSLATWAHGSETKSYNIKYNMWNRLLHTNGTRCCVGFLAKNMGVPDKILSKCTSLGDVADSSPKFEIFKELATKIIVSGIYDDNDHYMKSSDRKRILKRKFKTLGIELEFVP